MRWRVVFWKNDCFATSQLFLLTSQLHPFLTCWLALLLAMLCTCAQACFVNTEGKDRFIHQESSKRKVLASGATSFSCTDWNCAGAHTQIHSYRDRRVCTQIIYGDMFVVERVWTLFSLKCLLVNTAPTNSHWNLHACASACVYFVCIQMYKHSHTDIRTYKRAYEFECL